MKPTAKGILLASLPSLLVLALYYSLAIHMYQSLGGWPTSIGERGFSPGLVGHAHLTAYSFMALVGFNFLVLPLLALGSIAFPHLRRYLQYFGMCGLSLALCWGAMQLAPSRFLHWWND